MATGKKTIEKQTYYFDKDGKMVTGWLELDGKDYYFQENGTMAKGEVEIECGVIVAKRHIHFDPKTAEEFGLVDKQVVSVKVGENTGRATLFSDVVIRVHPNFAPAMHIDTDESNAAALGCTVDGEIIK